MGARVIMSMFEPLASRILPCRCGQHPKMEAARTEDGVVIWLECECGARGELVGDEDMIFAGMAEDAVDAWNREHGQKGAA